MADELLQMLESAARSKDYQILTELKDQNRGMILLLLEKIAHTGNRKFIPLLEEWQEIDYKKVEQAIQHVINRLNKHKHPGKPEQELNSGK